jgi:DNA adenine methylase
LKLERPKPGTPVLSPLRYPGSKRRLAGYLEEVLCTNDLLPSLYVEPFAGGASVALQLLCNRRVESVVLGDLDPLVSSFWKTVFFDTEWLVDSVLGVEVTIDKWKEIKESKPRSNRMRALKCLFLNRTSYSGILAPSGGPVGGTGQSSEYSIDCRFPRSTIVKRIRQAASFGDQVRSVRHTDWQSTLDWVGENMREIPPADTFLYLDPPFYAKSNRLYSFHFTEGDHIALRDHLLQESASWLVSYDTSPEIEHLYKANGTSPKRVSVLYSLSSHKGSREASELLISNLSSLPTVDKTWDSGSTRPGRARLT